MTSPLLCRLDYRMTWEDEMKKYLKKLEETKPVIYCGDLNVAHNEIGKPGLFLPIIEWNR